MTEFGRDLQELLRVMERETNVTSDDRARMRKKLTKRLGGAALAASTAGSITAHASRGATFKLGTWLLKTAKLASVWHAVPLALAIGAAASVPLVHAVRSPRANVATTVAPDRMPREVQVSPPASAPQEIPLVIPSRSEASRELSPVPHPSRVTSVHSPPPAPTSATASHADRSTNASSLSEEYALISRMHRALGAHDQGDLSRAIDEHGRRFASGVLHEEREAMRAMLECMRASTPEQAKEIASKFLALHPHSLHAARVEASCTDRSP